MQGSRLNDPLGSGFVLAGGLAFFILGLFLLVFTGASLGTLHALAAFIVLAIVAALNQLLPVLTHAPVARPQTVVAVAGGFALGFLLLIGGFFGTPTFFAAAAVLSMTALAWVTWNMARLFTGKEEGQMRALIACALLAFGVAAGIGASMAGGLAGRWAAATISLAPLHAAIAILGFASLLIVAISYRFVPMFAVAHGSAYGKRSVQWFAVAGVVTITTLLYHPLGLRIGLAGLFTAACVIARTHTKTVAFRLRKRLDVSLRHGSVAWVLGIVALAAAFAATWNPRLWLASLTLGILGWLCITILGYTYKVAGFLAWQTAKERDPSAQLPALSGALSPLTAHVGLALLAFGAVVSAAFDVVNPAHAQLGYDLFAAGGACAVAALSKLVSIYLFRRTPSAIATGIAG